MFVLIKDLHFIVEYVEEKLYFSSVGRKNSFILPRIKVCILEYTTHAISFTFNSLAVYCSSIVPRSIDTSTNFHQNNTQTQRSSIINRKKELICISDQHKFNRHDSIMSDFLVV